MEKILITVLLIVSSILYSDCRSHNHALISDNLSTKFGCVCNLGSKPTVPEIYYKKENHHYERTVIYLYRNKKSKEILIHIPDNIKQKYLPDINYEKEDILKPIRDEKIVDIFHNYTKSIIIYNDHGKLHDPNSNKLDVSTTTPKIYNIHKIPTNRYIVDKDDRSKILPVKIPLDKQNNDGKILTSHPQDLTKNQYKPVAIKRPDNKKHRDHNHGVDFVPGMTELPTNIHFPNYIISKPKPTLIKHPYVTKNKTNHNVKYPNLFFVTPSNRKEMPKKPYGIHFPHNVKPIPPGNNNFSQNPSSIPLLDPYVQRPSKYPVDKLYNIPDRVKMPPPKHSSFPDHGHKHQTHKPERIPYRETPSNVDPLKKNPYETLIDIIINYPQLEIKPNGKGVKTPSKIETIKNDVTSSKNRSPIIRWPTSTEKYNQFDIDTSDIYYENPDKIHIPDPNQSNDRLHLPKAVTEIPQNHELPGPVYIPGHIPNNRVPINIDSKKPNHWNNYGFHLPKAVTEIPQSHKLPGPVYIPGHTPNNRDPININLKKPNYWNNDGLYLPISFTEIPQRQQLPGPVYIPGHIPNNRDPINIDPKKPNYWENDGLHFPKAVTEIPQSHKLPRPVYIPEHTPNNQDPININLKKPNHDELLCIYCNQNRKKYNDGSLSIGYKTFDQWFREEMHGFKYNEYDIDVNWVGEYIIKVLNENGLHISKNGLLIDSSGKFQPWQNLKLRAMLVGDALSLDTIWKSTASKSSNPEYLAFVILTSLDPPQNLGIIPLGRTVLPYSTASLQSLSKVKKPNEIGFYKKLYPKVKANTYIKRSPNEYDQSVERFLKTLPHHSQDNNAIFDEDAQDKNSDKNKHNHDYINSEDLFGNDDMLRIIGGSAATGSGTPVSSKGRSLKLDA